MCVCVSMCVCLCVCVKDKVNGLPDLSSEGTMMADLVSKMVNAELLEWNMERK